MIAPVTVDFWATINVSVNIKGEALTSVKSKLRDYALWLGSCQNSDETELVTVRLQQ